jgi:aminoglycoside/choline kinase family phosphotransferase
LAENTNRQAQALAFLATNGVTGITPEPLDQDASARRYFRLPGLGLLLMDAPPPGENPAAFVRVTALLHALGARVPRIHGADTALGFILLEDLGNDTFSRLLARGEPEEAMYRSALDALVEIQHASPELAGDVPLPSYDQYATLNEACLFTEWYLPARLGRALSATEQLEYRNLWLERFQALPALDAVLVHRDFHVDNLLLCHGRCAMLDYQDALLGSPVYDLVSLLEDARRDVAPDLRRSLATEWRERMAVPGEVFNRHYGFWGAQRHAKVAGIFVRLWLRDGKPGYLVHLDRVMDLLSARLEANPEMSPIRNWILTRIPELAHGAFAGDSESLRVLCGRKTVKGTGAGPSPSAQAGVTSS